MEFNKCNRCGGFYISKGNVCPKCLTKDNLEFSMFKSYLQENGFEQPLDIVSSETGISTKNLNRFVQYGKFQEYKNEILNNNLVESIN